MEWLQPCFNDAIGTGKLGILAKEIRTSRDPVLNETWAMFQLVLNEEIAG
jgi:hypothetical protein